MISRSWPLPAIIFATVLTMATPAGAAVLPVTAETTAPAVPPDDSTSQPNSPVPTLEAEIEPFMQPVPEPSADVPIPEIGPETPDTSTVPDPSPSAMPSVPAADGDLSETNEIDLESLIGILGAKMGQGLERIEATADPQVPGELEIAERLEAEQTLIQEDLADPRLATPVDTAPEGSASTTDEVQVAPASSFKSLGQEALISSASLVRPAGLQGMDVSSHQPSVNWRSAWNQGARYAYVKATEATSYKNPLFSSQSAGAAGAGMLRGAYHFAIPNVSSGATQANYFLDNGGNWTADGKTLPPLLDVEYNPYPSLGNSCYDMSPVQMVDWIRDFSATVVARTGRVPMIYTTTDWWKTCTGNSRAFADHPLHIASYAKAVGELPSGWPTYTLWQYSSTGPFEGDSNVYSGTLEQMVDFARGRTPVKTAAHYFQGSTVSGLSYGHTSDSFLTCDWDGDGVATPAAFRNGTWYIRDSLTGSAPAKEIRYGEPGDQPVCGDWDGDGRDTVGVYRNGTAYLRNANTTGKAHGTFAFGAAHDVPLVGDWNGDGYDTLGVARVEGIGMRFYLTNSNIQPSVAHSFIYGEAGDTPVAGDWNNDGYSTVGVQRGNVWFLTDTHHRPTASRVFAFGNPGDRPLTGTWTRGGGTSVGVTR